MQKLARADVHLCTLETQMRQELDAKEYTVTREAQTKVTELSTETIIGGMELLDPPDLWQLALRNTWRASRERKLGNAWPPEDTEFPIYASSPTPRTAKRLETKLSRFRPADRKLVANVQPHKRGNLAHAEPLWMLRCIRNTDAHRTLHTVLASVPASALGQMLRVAPTPEGGQAFYFPQLLKEAVRFDELSVGDVVQTTVKAQATFAPYVAFAQRGADFHGQEVLPLLHRCRDEVERILGLF